jgi:hypothetical protein
MKTFISVVLVILVSSTLGACKGKEQPVAPAPPAAAPAAPAAAPAAQPAAPAAPAAAPAAISAVADLPDYPGATVVKTESETKAGFAKSLEVKFTSTDTFGNVKTFYEAAIAANGWQITSTADKPGEVKWYLSRGTSTGRVEIESEHGTLKIKLERNDK